MKTRYLCIISLLLIIVACKNSQQNSNLIDSQDLQGVWKIKIQEAELNGVEELTMEASTFHLKDSLTYLGSDSGFDFSMDVNLSISGRWIYRNDSLIFYYDKEQIIIDPDYDSFNISLNRDGGNQENLPKIKNEMAVDLGNNLKASLTEQFKEMNINKPIYKGKPLKLYNDTLEIISQNTIFIYTKTADL